MPAVMIKGLDSLDVKHSIKSRKPLSRTRTLDGNYPSSSFGRLDKDKRSNEGGRNGASSIEQRHKVKKSVKFADESKWENHIFEPVVAEKDELKDWWVLPDELKEIKKQGFLACKEAKRTGLAGLLTEIYGTANDRDTQDRLNYWCRNASPCRGLERFANEELSKRRTVYRKRAIVSVLEAQQQLKNEKGIDTANVLRRLSEAYTEQARVFAEKLGAADWRAIQTVKAAPQAPVPLSPKSAAAAKPASGSPKNDDTNGKKLVGRKSRTERMKERAVATEQKSQQQQQQQGENGVAFRRNNTTMSAVVFNQ